MGFRSNTTTWDDTSQQTQDQLWEDIDRIAQRQESKRRRTAKRVEQRFQRRRQQVVRAMRRKGRPDAEQAATDALVRRQEAGEEFGAAEGPVDAGQVDVETLPLAEDPWMNPRSDGRNEDKAAGQQGGDEEKRAQQDFRAKTQQSLEELGARMELVVQGVDDVKKTLEERKADSAPVGHYGP